MTGQFWPPASDVDAGRFEPGRTLRISTSIRGAHAVEFSKTAAPGREGDSFTKAHSGAGPEAGPMSIAPFSWEPEAPARRAHRTGRGSIARSPRPSSGFAPKARPAGSAARRRRLKRLVGRAAGASGQHRHRHDLVARAVVEGRAGRAAARGAVQLAAHDRHGLRRRDDATRRCARALMSWSPRRSATRSAAQVTGRTR
jgi:hypothetical protein